MANDDTTEKTAIELKPREVEILGILVICLKQKPDTSQVDMDKFAELSGYTLGSAKKALGSVLRKVFSGGAAEATPAKKGGGKKRKAADDDDDEPTPSKKTAKTNSKAKASKDGDGEDGAADGVKEESFF